MSLEHKIQGFCLSLQPQAEAPVESLAQLQGQLSGPDQQRGRPQWRAAAHPSACIVPSSCDCAQVGCEAAHTCFYASCSRWRGETASMAELALVSHKGVLSALRTSLQSLHKQNSDTLQECLHQLARLEDDRSNAVRLGSSEDLATELALQYSVGRRLLTGVVGLHVRNQQGAGLCWRALASVCRSD